MQAAAALAVVAMIDDCWERIMVNYEMQRTSEGRILDTVIFYIAAESDGSLEETSVRVAPDGVNARFIELADAVAQEGEPWGTCDFVIDLNGTYDVRFDDAPPRRINGIFDYKSLDRFDDCLDTYRAERAAGLPGWSGHAGIWRDGQPAPAQPECGASSGAALEMMAVVAGRGTWPSGRTAP